MCEGKETAYIPFPILSLCLIALVLYKSLSERQDVRKNATEEGAARDRCRAKKWGNGR